ncbi:MAG: cation:proton antiporter [Phycisphaerae bacterium]|nr:cation:proton antiporter [Phycisphaerae bacterium]
MKHRITLILAFAVLLGLMYAVRLVATPLPQIGVVGPYDTDLAVIGVGRTLGFLLLGGWILGELVRSFGLPRLSGYLVFGIVFGPYLPEILGDGTAPLWTTFLPSAHLEQLRLVDQLAIALIALTAGSELQLSLLKRVARAALAVCLSDAFAVLACVGGFLFLASDHLPPLDTVGPEARLFLCIAIGTLMISNSPAVVIAVLKETKARGPLQELTLAVTIAKDLLLIVATTALLAIGVAILSVEGDASADSAIWSVVTHLLGSIGVGAAIGAAMSLVLRFITIRLELVIVGLGFGIALLSSALHLAPLLVGLAAGFVQTNLWPGESKSFFRGVGDLMLPVSVVFFANTGASVDLGKLVVVWTTALMIAGVRLAAVYGGASLGARLGGVEPQPRRWAWTAFVPQAGVSLALAREFESTFRSFGWAAQAYVVLVAVIAINEIIGPPLFRLGLARCREIRA